MHVIQTFEGEGHFQSNSCITMHRFSRVVLNDLESSMSKSSGTFTSFKTYKKVTRQGV